MEACSVATVSNPSSLARRNIVGSAADDMSLEYAVEAEIVSPGRASVVDSERKGWKITRGYSQ